LNLINDIIKVKSKQAIEMSKKLSRNQGLLVGISTGANVFAALKIAKKHQNVVTILPDRTKKYLH